LFAEDVEPDFVSSLIHVQRYTHSTEGQKCVMNVFCSQWKSSCRGRSRASPHIKTYARASPDGTRIGWCLVTRSGGLSFFSSTSLCSQILSIFFPCCRGSHATLHCRYFCPVKL